MRKYEGIPELLQQYMEEQDADRQWVTVQELRDRFGLTRYQCNTVSGFLRRLECSAFGRFSYTVLRIESIARRTPSDPPKYRYLVQKKTLPAAALTVGMSRHTGRQTRQKAGSSGHG
jgi:hypothetical protein